MDEHGETGLDHTFDGFAGPGRSAKTLPDVFV
jgi:hypothetical protein